ncbi:MAG: 50S ribosomal protein L25, partial [Endomicrobiia bacterium]
IVCLRGSKMEEILLEAQKRERLSKGKIKDFRKSGMIPAVVYGAGEENVLLFVNEKDIVKILHKGLGVNVLIKLKYDNTAKSVLIKEIQRDIVYGNLLHIDFQVVSLKKEIEVEVPIQIVGEAPGVKNQGGILEHILRTVRIKCLPTEIPKTIEVDVSSLNIGDNILVKDLKIPGKIEIISDKNSIVVHVVSPTKVEEVTPAEGLVETPAEPEVISKGKKEVPEEEAAATQSSSGKTVPAPEKTPKQTPQQK